MMARTTTAAGRRRLAIAAMLTPGLSVFVLLFAFPLLNTMRLSLQGPDGLTLAHYDAFVKDPRALDSLMLAAILGIGCTAVVFLLSLPLALMARRRGPLQTLLQPLTVLPLVMPPIISAFGLLIFWKNNGWFNLLLMQGLGFAGPVKINYTLAGLLLFYVWLYLPYTLLNAIAAVRAIDPAIEHAARVSGAGDFTVFRRITLPLMLPGLLTGSVLTFVMAFGAFTVPLIAGGNLRPLAVQIYTVATVFNKWEAASAMAVVMALIQIAVLAALLGRAGFGAPASARSRVPALQESAA